MYEKVNCTGWSPKATLGSLLSLDFLHAPEPKFIRLGKPNRYFLVSRRHEINEKMSLGLIDEESSKIDDASDKKTKVLEYTEQNLHPISDYIKKTFKVKTLS